MQAQEGKQMLYDLHIENIADERFFCDLHRMTSFPLN